MTPYYISMIKPHLTNTFKVKHGSILNGYYKSHGVVIKVIYGVCNRKVISVDIIKIYWLINTYLN